MSHDQLPGPYGTGYCLNTLGISGARKWQKEIQTENERRQARLSQSANVIETIRVNTNNTKLSDRAFRTFVRNALKTVPEEKK